MHLKDGIKVSPIAAAMLAPFLGNRRIRPIVNAFFDDSLFDYFQARNTALWQSSTLDYSFELQSPFFRAQSVQTLNALFELLVIQVADNIPDLT
jgi:hypothetical protein